MYGAWNSMSNKMRVAWTYTFCMFSLAAVAAAEDASISASLADWK